MAMNISTKRLQMIADDLAKEGLSTRGASVWAVTAERDALWKLVQNIHLIATCESKPTLAVNSIIEIIKVHTEKEQERDTVANGHR